jgi:hypothetical protein
MMGTREEGTIQFYSAKGPDYLKPDFRSLLYGRWSDGGFPERALFPRLMPVALTAVALWPPLSAARIAYALGLVLAVDGSLGFNGATFTSLHAVLSPFKGLRVPARFSLLAGMTMAILAGYGAARLLERWPRKLVALTAAMLTLVVTKQCSRHAARAGLARAAGYLCRHRRETTAGCAGGFPMPGDIYRSAFDARYRIFHIPLANLVNGNSGFFPPSYVELLERERSFPSEAALDYLRSRGVQYLTMHGRFTNPTRYNNTVAWLDARQDLELVAAAPWEGAESRLYRLR